MTSEEFRNNPLFLRNHFKGQGVFQLPLIKKNNVDLSDLQLLGYDKLSSNQYEKIVHFFLDDYKFEAIWNNPDDRVERLSKYKAVLSPQFSVYTEMPASIQIYQTFRNRWCGAYLQSNGIKVIPSLAWGEPDTYWFCFDGIEKGGIVAVSTIGVRKEKELFLSGYNEMLRKINPCAIICYGKAFEEMKGNIFEVDYASTNNYKSSNLIYVHKTYFYDDFLNKGMGSAGGQKNVLPKNDSQIKHIFREKSGHIPDTPDNRKLLEELANKKENYIGTDMYGNEWYSQTQSDGSQVWVTTRGGIIQNGGVNNPPKSWNADTGYSRSKGAII